MAVKGIAGNFILAWEMHEGHHKDLQLKVFNSNRKLAQ